MSNDIHNEVRESFCEGCKGQRYMNESGCYETCDAYKREYVRIQREWGAEALKGQTNDN